MCHCILFYMFVIQRLYFSFQHTNNAYEVHFMYICALLCFLKNLIPWQDLNPGLRVPDPGQCVQ
jgi:hypothetical protein